MRVLLDEQVDWRLKRLFDSGHRVETVREQGWAGKRNGELLRLAAPVFDVLLTMDRGTRRSGKPISENMVWTSWAAMPFSIIPFWLRRMTAKPMEKSGSI